MSAPTLEKILQAVNEKYGTSSEGWSQLPTAYEVGDTVPNWNAYEKMYLLVNIKTIGPNVAGYIKDDTGYIYTKNNLCFTFNFQSGNVLSDSGPKLDDGFKNVIISRASDASYVISKIEPKEENFEIGQTMQNWNEYVII